MRQSHDEAIPESPHLALGLSPDLPSRDYLRSPTPIENNYHRPFLHPRNDVVTPRGFENCRQVSSERGTKRSNDRLGAGMSITGATKSKASAKADLSDISDRTTSGPSLQQETMLPRGRPPGPGTAEEKAAIRREKVRLNVKAYRERKKNALLAASSSSPASSHGQPSPTQSNTTVDTNSDLTTVEDQHGGEEDPDLGQVAIRSKSTPTSTSVQSRPKQSWQDGFSETVVLAPDSGLMFSQAFLSIFRSSFLPSTIYLPPQDSGSSLLVTPCSPWITSAYDMATRQDTGALKSGLLAVGLILSALQNSRSELKVASFQMHKQALSQLRNDLGPITLQRQRKRSGSNIIAPYLACLAVTMFELVQRGFSPIILQHVRAMNSLIEIMYADPDVDNFMADLIMEDFGMLEILFCLKYGFCSVLRNTRRKIAMRRRQKGSTAESRRNASVYGDILDIVSELPSLIIQTRSLQDQGYSSSARNNLKVAIRKLTKIQEDLAEWDMQFEVRYGSTLMQETFLDQNSGKSGARACLRSYEHGAVGLYVLNFQLCALDTIIEAYTKILAMRQTACVYADTEPAQMVSGPSPRFAPDPTDAQRESNPKVIGLGIFPVPDDTDFICEQLKSQRSRARSMIMDLLQVIILFKKVALNITGQSFLIGPCDTVRDMLSKERARLGEDLLNAQAGDCEAAAEINDFFREVNEASDIFEVVEQSLRQDDNGDFYSS